MPPYIHPLFAAWTQAALPWCAAYAYWDSYFRTANRKLGI